MNKIAIIGSGALGSALISRFKKSGIDVRYYDHDINKPRNSNSIKEAVTNTTVVFLCIPTKAINCVLSDILKFNKKAIIVSLSKGMTSDGKTAAEILSKILINKNNFAVIGGPMIAKEIEAGDRSVIAVIGATNKDVSEVVKDVFTQSGIEAVENNNPFAVSFLGVLKNTYAFGMGILVGLGVSQNEQDFFIKIALLEMKIFCQLESFDIKIADTPVGKGDLIKTGNSEESRNRTMGFELAKTGMISTFGESFESAPQFADRFSSLMIKMPIFNFLVEVIKMRTQAKEIISLYKLS